ncbi:MAG TPA: undecaprenyl-diphosphate phosphatase [Acidimicrobiales bacterium]|nr:undecaprenyl-diphosphate phosphatase [Acidimicrobiales bacterium]
MPIVHAIVLGIVQGLTEFLPVSSSGHLRLVPWLFGWNDFADAPHLEQTFDVALHIGTLVGAVAYFRRDLVRYAVAGFTDRSSPDGRLAWLLLASSIPAAITGALLEETFADLGEREWVIGVLLVVFGLVLLVADRLGGTRVRTDYGPRDALLTGVAQALALTPGVSRSGVTITTARWLGFDRDAAARLSFLMSLPIIAGAIAYKSLDVVGDFPPGFTAPFVWGIVASGVTGWVAVWATLRVVRTRTFSPFVAYRVAVGLGVILLAASSLR